MKIVCLLNSEASYERIKNQIYEDAIKWQLETSIERLRLILTANTFELAIIDENMPDYEEIIELLDMKQIKMLIFRGQYEEIIADTKRKAKKILEEEAEEEKEYIRFTEQEERESTKVIIKEVIKTERIEVPVIQTSLTNSIIAVINLSERAGSSFVAMNLARAFADHDREVTLYESPIANPDYFYTMGFNSTDKSFFSYRKAMRESGRVEKKYLPVIDGVKLAVNDIETNEIQWNANDTLRLLAAQNGINIIDIGWSYDNPVLAELYNIATNVLVVVDPVNVQIVKNENRLMHFEQMENDGINIQFVLNKWDDCIGLNQFIEGFCIEPYMKIPHFEQKHIYEMYYNPKFRFLYDQTEINEEINNSFKPIFKEYLIDTQKNSKIRKKFFSFMGRL